MATVSPTLMSQETRHACGCIVLLLLGLGFFAVLGYFFVNPLS